MGDAAAPGSPSAPGGGAGRALRSVHPAPTAVRLAALLLLALAAPLQAQDLATPPGRAVMVESVGPYLLGGGVAVQARVRPGVEVRGGVGVRELDPIGGGGHAAATVTALATTGSRRVGVEGGAGLTLALSREPTAGARDRGPAVVPHGYAGFRFSAPQRALDGKKRLPPDLVLRVGSVLVFDRVGTTPSPVLLPSLAVGLAF